MPGWLAFRDLNGVLLHSALGTHNDGTTDIRGGKVDLTINTQGKKILRDLFPAKAVLRQTNLTSWTIVGPDGTTLGFLTLEERNPDS